MRRADAVTARRVRPIWIAPALVVKWALLCSLWIVVWYAALTPISIAYNEVSGPARLAVGVAGNIVMFGWPLAGVVLAVRRGIRFVRHG